MTARPIHARGFTLLELMLVVVILSVLMGATVLSLRSGYLSVMLDADAQLLGESIHTVQTHARTRNVICRIRIDPPGNRYCLEASPAPEKPFALLRLNQGAEFSLSEGVAIADVRQTKEATHTNEFWFYPSGECEAGSIALQTSQGERKIVEIGSFAGPPVIR